MEKRVERWHRWSVKEYGYRVPEHVVSAARRIAETSVPENIHVPRRHGGSTIAKAGLALRLLEKTGETIFVVISRRTKDYPHTFRTDLLKYLAVFSPNTPYKHTSDGRCVEYLETLGNTVICFNFQYGSIKDYKPDWILCPDSHNQVLLGPTNPTNIRMIRVGALHADIPRTLDWPKDFVPPWVSKI